MSLLRRLAVSLAAISLFVMAGPILNAQITSATMLGTVVDPSGQAIPGAKVDLVNEGTGVTERSLTTDANGSFVASALFPGVYTIRVEAAGFQRLERKTNNLVSGDRLAVPDLQLTVGSVTETVSVVAQGAQVQTASSESSALLTAKQIDTIAQKGRVITNYLLLLPGVSTNGGTFDAASSFMNVPNANGLSNQMTAISIDGFQGADTTSPNLFVTNVNPDAIGEMTVLSNNYQAEYGRNGGASVNIITKSGTNRYHGTAYWYKRHEMFNANDFFFNRTGRVRPLYRFNTEGVSIGGPVLPPILKRTKDKLFFFYNFDRSPSTAKTRVIATLPTALEKNGDFSQSRQPGNAANPLGALIAIRDPNTGNPFGGNIIPASRLNNQGQRILNIYGTPNAVGANAANNFGNFNNDFGATTAVARLQHIYRIDYRPTDKDSLNFRGAYFITDTDNQMALNQPAAGVGFDFSNMGFKAPNKTWVLGWTRILSPSMINEWTGGIRRAREFFEPKDADALRSTYGLTFGQFGPQKNPLGILPSISFGSLLPNLPTLGTYGAGRYGANEADFVYYWQDNFTINKNSHTFKLGIYFEKQRTSEGIGLLTTPFGSINFQADANNPNDARHPFANAVLGNFQQYTESQLRTRPAAVTRDWEWFVQDSWKVNKRLTLDYGLRAVNFTPFFAWNGLGTQWAFERYDRTKAPLLYQPTRVNNVNVGLDPRNGNTVIAPLIGTFIPNTGDPGVGTLTSKDPNYPKGFVNNDGWKFQPRFGFALDPTGKGKTAIRGGFSTTHQKLRLSNRPAGVPLSFDPVLFWGNISTFLGASSALAPGNVLGIEKDRPAPTIYNLSLGVQQDVGHQTIVDVKWLTTLARHLATFRELETLPYGKRFEASSINPLTNSLFPDTFLRPLPGYNSITHREGGGSSYYHALQAAVNRRFSSGVQFGVSYTYSKAMDYTQSISPAREGSLMPTYLSAQTWSKGKSGFDQTHMFALNYTYMLPSFGKKMGQSAGAGLARVMFDNWELSGITSFSSGTPANVGICTSAVNGGAQCNMSIVGNPDYVGGGDGIRAIITGDARIPHSERTVDRMFNTSVFASPVRGTAGNVTAANYGNVGNGIVRLPGVINSDATLFKRFPLPGEGKNLELRWEVYNIFNHTQFNNMNISPTFTQAGVQINGAFGQATSVRPPRIMQVALRIRF